MIRYLFDPDIVCRSVPVGHGVVLLQLIPDSNDPRDWLVQHVCRESCTESGEMLTEVTAPQMGPRHRITFLGGAISIEPSIQCYACTLHGWVFRGVWYPATYKTEKRQKKKKFTLVRRPKWAKSRR